MGLTVDRHGDAVPGVRGDSGPAGPSQRAVAVKPMLNQGWGPTTLFISTRRARCRVRAETRMCLRVFRAMIARPATSQGGRRDVVEREPEDRVHVLELIEQGARPVPCPDW